MAIAIILILMFSMSLAMMTIQPAKAALTPVTVTAYFSPFIGVNTPTEIDYFLSPNILATDPAYNASTQNYPLDICSYWSRY